MKKTIASLALATLPLFANHLVEHKTNLSVDEVVTKATKILQEKNLKIFSVFEHSKLAKDVNLEMTDTSVIVFGSPKVGTLLMQCSPKIALELPLKFLVYKAGNETILAYEDIKNIAKRYDANCEITEKLSIAQENLAKAITKN